MCPEDKEVFKEILQLQLTGAFDTGDVTPSPITYLPEPSVPTTLPASLTVTLPAAAPPTATLAISCSMPGINQLVSADRLVFGDYVEGIAADPKAPH